MILQSITINGNIWNQNATRSLFHFFAKTIKFHKEHPLLAMDDSHVLVKRM